MYEMEPQSGRPRRHQHLAGLATVSKARTESRSHHHNERKRFSAMSTPRFRMRSITAWSELLTAEEGVLAPEAVERLEAAYERAKQIVAALPFIYDPLWLLTGHRPEGWEYFTGALRP